MLDTLLHWLRDYLAVTEEETLIDIASWAMYSVPLARLGADAAGCVRGFVAALKAMAGKRHLVALLRCVQCNLW